MYFGVNVAGLNLKALTGSPRAVGRRRSVARCIFCGSPGPLTNEHMWARWTHRYQPRRSTRHHVLRTTVHKTQTDFRVFKRSGDITDWQVRCVCARCNNGWMSKDVEQPAIRVMAPLLEGQAVRLWPSDQAKIAAWAVMKYMVADAQDGGRNVTTHHTQRKRMWHRQLPPARGWGVWIGLWDRSDPKAALSWASTPFLALSVKRAGKRAGMRATFYNSDASTQVIGKLFIHVVHSPVPNLARKFSFNLPSGGTLYRIWPTTNTSVIWPPKGMSDWDAHVASVAVHNFAAKAALQQESGAGGV